MGAGRYGSTVYLIALLLSPSGLLPAAQLQGVPYGQSVRLGSATFRDGDACLSTVGYMGSGDFFEGLRPNEARRDRKFYKGSQRVKNYPDELMVVISASAFDCAKGPIAPVPPSAEARIHNLAFAVAWKEQMEPNDVADMSRVKGFTVKTTTPQPRVWDDQPALTGPSVIYVITIDSKGVPLTEDLVVDVRTADGAAVARMTAHL